MPSISKKSPSKNVPDAELRIGPWRCKVWQNRSGSGDGAQ